MTRSNKMKRGTHPGAAVIKAIGFRNKIIATFIIALYY